MHIYKTRWFNKWAIKEGLADQALKDVIDEMNSGLIDVGLGGFVYKKRVAMTGQGKSGGLRTILAFKMENSAFFMFGFAKNQRDNISSKELKALKDMAKEMLGYSEEQLAKAVVAGSLIEVKIDE